MSALLDVRDLQVDFDTGAETVRAVAGLDLTVQRGDCLGVVGESGCGKSVSMLAVMGLLPEQARITGSIRFDGNEIGAGGAPCPRGAGISMVFQDSMSSLNPLMRVGNQVAEVLRFRSGCSWRQARSETVEHLARVQLADPEHTARLYPHELSGGMRQRVMIASALAAHPRLLIADEATTGLDVTVQAAIIDLLADLQDELDLTIIFISHDLGAVAEVSDQVAVVYGGRVVEFGPTDQVVQAPQHPYTRALLDSYPRLGVSHERLRTIDGSPPTVVPADVGCPFRPRCPSGDDLCAQPIERHQVAETWDVACVRPGDRS